MFIFRIFYLLYIFYKEIVLFVTLPFEQAIQVLVNQDEKNLKLLKDKILKSPLLIKLIQWTTQYRTGLPYKFNDVLCSLQSECKEHDISNLTKIILKYKLELSDISILPNSSGSVGSVYYCVYQGKKAVIKILHKNVVSDLKNDLYILKIIQFFYKALNFDEVCKIMNLQTNLKNETNNLLRIKENCKHLPFVIIPDVLAYDEEYMICTYEQHVHFTELGEYLDESKIYLGVLYLKMLVIDKFIHGDLHNGNVLYRLENNQLKIVLVDFGICNAIEQSHLDYFVNITQELCSKNYQKMISLLCELSLYQPNYEQKNELRLLVNSFIYEGKIKSSRNLPNLGIQLVYKIIDRNILTFPGTFLYILSNYLLIDHAYNANDLLYRAKLKICCDKELVELFGYDIYQIKNNLELLMSMKEK